MKLQAKGKHEDTAKPVKSREIVVAGVRWPSLTAWWKAQPEPKCSYSWCYCRVQRGEKYEDAIRPKPSDNKRGCVAGVQWPGLKAWWRTQPKPKCSYNTCYQRVEKGEKYEDAIHRPSERGEIVVAGVRWPSLMAWWGAQPEPKCSYSVCSKRVKKGEKPEDAIRLVGIVVAGVLWPNLKAWWRTQPEPKCSYGVCRARVKKGEKYEEALVR
jgi:hypothetical protein